jgi:hypothetical protein
MAVAVPPRKALGTGGKPNKVDAFQTRMRDVIVRLMSTYGPKLSITMIGIHVRPYGAEWRSVFEEMVLDGTVIRETQNVDGRIVFIHTLAPNVPNKIAV